MCIAAPIFDVESVVAAISMACPITRMDQTKAQQSLAMIREIAFDLSEQLGCHTVGNPA
jgi:DNA-binding IclR family transcriptional regulator